MKALWYELAAEARATGHDPALARASAGMLLKAFRAARDAGASYTELERLARNLSRPRTAENPNPRGSRKPERAERRAERRTA